MKTKYYSLKNISHNTNYNIILGQYLDGKTFSLIDLMITNFCLKGVPSICIQQKDEELLNSKINMLLKPHIANIIKYSKGKYNSYICKSRIVFLTYIDDKGDIKYTSEPCIYFRGAMK